MNSIRTNSITYNMATIIDGNTQATEQSLIFQQLLLADPNNIHDSAILPAFMNVYEECHPCSYNVTVLFPTQHLLYLNPSYLKFWASTLCYHTILKLLTFLLVPLL